MKFHYGDAKFGHYSMDAAAFADADTQHRLSADTQMNSLGADQTHECQYCSAAFTSESALGEHSRTHAADEKVFDRQHCDITFSEKLCLDRRMEVVSNWMSPVSCKGVENGRTDIQLQEPVADSLHDVESSSHDTVRSDGHVSSHFSPSSDVAANNANAHNLRDFDGKLTNFSILS